MKTITTILLMAVTLSGFAQAKYFTRNGNISFFSSTPVEDIKADNFNATAVLDSKTGAFEFSVLMKSFNFKKALMQEHFNENYVESSKFPKSVFKGSIENISDVDFSKDGEYPVTVSGEITLHGVTKQITTPGVLTVSGEKINSNAVFKLSPEDFDIEIPSVVRDKIANEIEVTVAAELEALKR